MFFKAATFVHGQRPHLCTYNHLTRLEAKDWCNANHDFGNDTYVILNDKDEVIECGIIDGMYEEDTDHQARC
jgi:hypothetical protein